MTSLSRVVWSYGMHLAQHHFQAQSRYFEDLTGFAVRSLFYQPWGLASCQLDADALLNGTVSVTHAAGLMPDGLPFSFPEDPAPEPVDVREAFSPTAETMLVYLVVPEYRSGGANAGPVARFAAQTVRVPDEVTGEDVRPVEVAHGNFRVLLEGESLEGQAALPIARVRRDGAGHFVYDPDYIPPCLRIGASSRLLTMLQRLVEVMESQTDSLRAERAAAAGGAGTGYASREVAAFWLSHALHSSLPTLRGMLAARACHPEQLFSELSRLGGALCTFALGSHPRTLPLYDHAAPTDPFSALERHILEHLEVVLPTKGLTLPLQRADESYFVGAVPDERYYHRARWLMGVRSSVGPAELAERVPRLVKVCSAKHIAKLVARAYPALGLEPIITPPAAISPRFDTQYFSIQSTGPCWDLIRQTHEIGVYVPDAIPAAEVELCIMLEE
jgi:type VI secretion system protein ImpJ